MLSRSSASSAFNAFTNHTMKASRFSGIAAVLTLGVACTPAENPDTAAPTRPRTQITTAETFEAKNVAPYTGTHDAAYAWIDRNIAAHTENLRRWVRQPSVSAQNLGITEMAEMVRRDLQSLGFKEAELVTTNGHPGVWGYYDAGAEKTLAVYMMYDVQPVEPTGWAVNAFDGAIVDRPLGKVLMARGATNQKAPERAFLNALEAIIKSQGKLPVNLMIVAECEEELGSPNFPQIIDKYEDRLKTASGVFFPFNSQEPDGDVSVFLGVKGIVSFELEAKGGDHGGPTRSEIHGSYKVITDSPVLRLAHAIASLTTPDGNTILVPRYYDAIRPPSDEEMQLTNGMLPQWIAQDSLARAGLGVRQWAGGISARDALIEYLFNTTMNVDGMWAGYTGPGMKTILPHIATAKMDSRLVPDQDPDTALALIRAHLDAKGFTDVLIRKLSGYPPAQSSVSAPLVRAAIGTYHKYGFPPSVAPRLAGSAPYYVFTKRLNLPMIAGGIGHGSGAHGPDEYMVIEPKAGSNVAGLAAIEKFYVDLLYALAEAR